MQFMLGLAAAARYLYISQPTFLIKQLKIAGVCINNPSIICVYQLGKVNNESDWLFV